MMKTTIQNKFGLQQIETQVQKNHCSFSC